MMLLALLLLLLALLLLALLLLALLLLVLLLPLPLLLWRLRTQLTVRHCRNAVQSSGKSPCPLYDAYCVRGKDPLGSDAADSFLECAKVSTGGLLTVVGGRCG